MLPFGLLLAIAKHARESLAEPNRAQYYIAPPCVYFRKEHFEDDAHKFRVRPDGSFPIGASVGLDRRCTTGTLSAAI